MKILIPLAILMLLGAAFSHFPYSYYQFLRWVVCGVAVGLALAALEKKSQSWAAVFGFMAVLFNPIAPLHLERESWVPIDLLAAGLLTVRSLTPAP